jgi:Oxidoreductase molybdopterin binding domain
MTSASLDRFLAVLVVLLATTGLWSLRAGDPDDGWLFVVHGILAGLLTIAVAIKVRRSAPRAAAARRWRRLGFGLAISICAAGALAAGYLWVAVGEIVWLDVAGIVRWTLLTIHAWIGLVLVPLVIVHVLPSRWRLLRPDRGSIERAGARLLTRRTVLIGGGMLTAALAIRGMADAVELVRGGQRRFTGSRWLPAGGTPPPTTFFGEPPPEIDPATWRLRVGDRSFDLEGLRSLGTSTLIAVLDCTSGWAIETDWEGVPLASVLVAAGSSPRGEVVVRSATGWSTVLSSPDVARSLLAWSCAGSELRLGNGAPLRLVVPDRRGLDWVKWVTEIEV